MIVCPNHANGDGTKVCNTGAFQLVDKKIIGGRLLATTLAKADIKTVAKAASPDNVATTPTNFNKDLLLDSFHQVNTLKEDGTTAIADGFCEGPWFQKVKAGTNIKVAAIKEAGPTKKCTWQFRPELSKKGVAFKLNKDADNQTYMEMLLHYVEFSDKTTVGSFTSNKNLLPTADTGQVGDYIMGVYPISTTGGAIYLNPIKSDYISAGAEQKW